MKVEKVDLSLYVRAAQVAYRWISFNPDERGERMVKEQEAELKDDLEELESLGVDEEGRERYFDKYCKYLSSYIAAKGRTASMAITGGARFPVEKNNRALARVSAVYEEWMDWRKRFKTKVNRDANREEKGDLVEYYTKKVAEGKAAHEEMKKVNAEYRAFLAGKAVVSEEKLQAFQKHKEGHEIYRRAFYQTFQLTNSLARIKHAEQMLKDAIRKQETAPTVVEAKEVEGVQIVHNTTENRLQLIFDGKPTEAVRNILKKNGYRWSPTQGAWQRQLTQNALYSLDRTLELIKEVKQ